MSVPLVQSTIRVGRIETMKCWEKGTELWPHLILSSQGNKKKNKNKKQKKKHTQYTAMYKNCK